MPTRLLAAAFGLLLPLSVHAQPLTLDQALALARQRAEVLTQLSLEEARAPISAAGRFLTSNPVIGAGAGARVSPAATTPELEVSVQQGISFGRSARVAQADAAVAVAAAQGEGLTQALMREAALAFFEALHAQERARLATEAAGFTAELERASDRRLKAGDLGILDFNAATVAAARADAARISAEGERGAALERLGALLGIEAKEVAGDFDAPVHPESSRGMSRPAAREPATAEVPPSTGLGANGAPLVATLRAELAQAEATSRVAATAAWPELTVGAQYKHEGADHAVLGLLSFTLPVFDRAQAEAATARARVTRLNLELQRAETNAAVTLRAARSQATAEAAAAARLTQILPRLTETEALAQKAFTAGELSLRDVLILRQQVLDARLTHLDQRLKAAAASVRAGALR